MLKKFLYIIITALALSSWSIAYASYPNTNAASITVGGSPTSCTIAKDYLFVTNSADDTVSVIDIAANSVTKNINVGGNPQHIITSSDGNTVYVSNTDDDSVSVLSVTSLSVTDTIANVGNAPNGMTLSPSGDKLYVACKESDSVVVISTGSKAKEREITMVGDAPAYAAVSPSGNYLYVTSEGTNAVVSINLTSYEVNAVKITVGTTPEGIAITPNGSYLYVANMGSDSIAVISVLSGSVVKTISNVGDGVRGVAILSNGEYVFATNSNTNTVSVINTLDNSITATLTAGSNPYGVAASSDNKAVYVTNKGSGTVSVFNDNAVILIDTVDNQRINNSGTSRISWHTTLSGTYQIEVGGDGNKGTGTVIESGEIAAHTQKEVAIVAATHLLNGDGTYKIYFYFTSESAQDYSNYATLILDNVAPSAPAELKAELGDTRTYLSWQESSEIDLDGYKVYYGTVSGTYDNVADAGLTNSYTLDGLTNGVTYYIVIAAVDLAGNESAHSNEVSITPDNVLSLSNVKGESGCFIATASYQNKKNYFLNTITNFLGSIFK